MPCRLTAALCLLALAGAARGCRRRGAGVLREAGAADPGGAVLRVPQRQERASSKGGLRLDSRAAALKGGDTGPAVVPGKPKESLLVDAINYGELYQMPPKSKLPAEEIAVLTKWVEMGAPWPAEDAAASGAARPRRVQPRQSARPSIGAGSRSANPPFPQSRIRNPESSNPIDAFILAKLEAKGLSPAPPADPRTLHPPRLFRSDRPAADARRRWKRFSPIQSHASAFENGRRSAARFAALRRALGPALARPGAVCRVARARVRLQHSQRVRVSRLRHPGAECRCALRPVRDRARRGRSAGAAAAASARSGSTSRSSARASGFWASGAIRRSIFARTNATGSTTCSTSSARRFWA